MQHHLTESHVKKISVRLERTSFSIGIGTRTSHTAQVKMKQGKEFFDYLKLCITSAELEQAVLSGNPRLPYGFYEGFFRNVLKRRLSKALQRQHKRALMFYLRAMKLGASTVAGTMAGLHNQQRRHCGGEMHSLKCPELGELLYTFVIDCVQVPRCRVDGNFLLRHAIFLKHRFLDKGVPRSELPALRADPQGASRRSDYPKVDERPMPGCGFIPLGEHGPTSPSLPGKDGDR